MKKYKLNSFSLFFLTWLILYLKSSDEDEDVDKSRVSIKDAANRFKHSIVDATDTGNWTNVLQPR